MIFLSHNYKDKPLVEQIALELRNVFSENEIFYDSWSIQPGDGIIDKMSEGLEKCKFFLFFVSQNSLASNAVRFEWQNTVMSSLTKDKRIIPIKLDDSNMPIILQQNLYLDLYNNGLEVVTRQIIDVITGTNTFRLNDKVFSNLKSSTTTKKDEIILEICAEHFLEAIPKFFIVFQDKHKIEEVQYNCLTDSTFESKMHEDCKFDDGRIVSGIYIKVSRGLNPKNPIIMSIKGKVKIKDVLHIEGSNGEKVTLKMIPLISNDFQF